MNPDAKRKKSDLPDYIISGKIRFLCFYVLHTLATVCQEPTVHFCKIKHRQQQNHRQAYPIYNLRVPGQ